MRAGKVPFETLRGTCCWSIEFFQQRRPIRGALRRRLMRIEIAFITFLWLALQVPLGSFLGDCIRFGGSVRTV